MIRLTTPTLRLTIADVDLIAYNLIIVSIVQGSMSMEINDAAVVDEHTLQIDFTQEQTARFNTGSARIQVNLIDAYGKRIATDIVSFAIGENLLRRVIT